MDDTDTDSGVDNLDTGDLLGNDATEELTPTDIPDEDESDSGDKGDAGEGKADGADYDKQIRNMQSLHDKQFSDQKAENAKLAGMVEALTRTQSSASDASLQVQDKVEQEAFTKEWMEKIEENPGMAVKYHQQMAQELISLTNAQMKRTIDERLESLDLDARFRSLQPGRKENQAKIDEFVEKYNVTEDIALQMVSDFSPKKGSSSSQPKRPKTPGRVDEGRVTGKADDIVPMELTAFDISTLKGAGLGDKEILKIRKDMARDAVA